MNRFLCLIAALSLLSTSCGKNSAKKPTVAPDIGLDGKPIQDDLPILGTWVSCVPLSDPLLSKPYGNLIEIAFSQTGKANIKITIYKDLNCQIEFTEADKTEVAAIYSASMPDEMGIGTLDVQISTGQKIIRRYDSYKLSEDQLVITNSEECEGDCEGVPGGSAENRNRDFSDAIAFDPKK